MWLLEKYRGSKLSRWVHPRLLWLRKANMRKGYGSRISPQFAEELDAYYAEDAARLDALIKRFGQRIM